jgi:transcription elongation factor Elf1
MVRKNQRILKGQICPFCGSDKVAAILWGLPMYSEGMQQLIDQRKLVFGGCILDETTRDQDLLCTKCEKAFSFTSQNKNNLCTGIG